jgi:hypothetical protein
MAGAADQSRVVRQPVMVQLAPRRGVGRRRRSLCSAPTFATPRRAALAVRQRRSRRDGPAPIGTACLRGWDEELVGLRCHESVPLFSRERPSRRVSIAWRTGRSASSSSGDSGKAGANPAARSSSLRSRSVSSMDSASRTTMLRPGRERPCSMKLTCLWVVSARIASSSWLSRRAERQRRSSVGKRVITGSSSRTSVIAAIPSRELLPDGLLRRMRP